MSRIIDLSGKQFGALTVLNHVGRDKWGQYLWRCRCSCGLEHVAAGGKLRRGEVKSCGCDKPRLCREANIKHGHTTDRGKAMTTEYRTWSNMIERCERPATNLFHRYGGRGIRVCERWRESFAAFLEDMGPRPSPDHQIDRIDNDGNYEPGNCRWVTRIQQSRNKSTNHIIEFRGRSMCLAEWAEVVGIPRGTLEARIYAGWSPERALTEPVHISARRY